MKFIGTRKTDTFSGMDNVSNLFQFTSETLSASDEASGGGGTSIDELRFTSAGTIAAASFAKVAGIELIRLANGSNSLTVTNALVGSASGNILKVEGGSGNDMINAAGVTVATDRVQITAGAGNDTLTGGAGADSFSFAVKDLTGSDKVVGGESSAQDQLVFTTAGTIAASAFTTVSGIEQTVLANGTNNLTLANALVGSAYGDILKVAGGSGNDRITGGRGSDTLDGGKGNDRLIATGATRLVVRLDVDAGLDQTSGNTDIVRNFENFNGAGMTTALTITGSRDANTLVGGSSNDIIDGKGGADTISGGGGDDRISMWEWNVSLNGGSGNDTLVFIRSWSVAIDLSAANQNVEGSLLLAGFENFDGSLATGDITISGNSAANVLIGGLGNYMCGVGTGDTVFGGAGHDTVLINTDGSPVLHLHGGDEGDQIVVSSAYDFRKSDLTGFENHCADTDYLYGGAMEPVHKSKGQQ